nr:MAG TPA: hypothetical protein [Caudoviricetes sp.]
MIRPTRIYHSPFVREPKSSGGGTSTDEARFWHPAEGRKDVG